MPSKKLDLIVTIPKKAPKGIPWQTLHFYSYLLSTTREKKTNGKWINCWSKTLKSKYGKDYKKHIDRAISLGWVEINDRYSSNRFTKSYRLSLDSVISAHKAFAVSVQERIWRKLLVKTPEDTSVLDSDYTRLIKSRHDTLRILNAKTVGEKKLKQKLDLKIANIKTSKLGRVSSTILLFKKDTRRSVIFGTRGKLSNVDVSSMIQQLLNREIQNQEWDRLVKKDLPTFFKNEFLLRASRDRIKVMFLVAISDGPVNGDTSIIRGYLNRNFPDIMAEVSKLSQIFGSVQATTQFQESLFIQRFIMANRGLEMIPANDGVFCGELDVETIQARLEKFLRDQGLSGGTKIKSYGKTQKVRTIVDILSEL